MSNTLKGFIKWLAIMVLIGCSTLAIMLYLAIDKSSQITTVEALDVKSAKQAQQSVQRIYQSLKSSQQVKQLVINKNELDGLLFLAHRAIPSLNLNSGLVAGVAQLSFSQQLPFGDYYANVSTLIYDSEHGIELGETSLGSLSISGNALLKLAEWLLNFYLDGDFGTQLLATVTSVKISDNNITLQYQMPNGIAGSEGDSIAKLMQLRDQWQFFGNVNDVRFYFDELVNFAEQKKSVLLADYIQWLLITAQTKTQQAYLLIPGNLEEQAIIAKKENHAALLALALYFGDDKFEWLIGQVANLSTENLARRAQLRASVTLANRVDLQKHFVYSMALQLFANVTTSDAIGEFKELLDANKGGSGFSFADLLADRAGTRFALLATKDEATAKSVQHYFATPVLENVFMPEHLDLPEGISEADFKRYYLNINSMQYREMVGNIDQRLLALPLYQ